MATVYEFPVKVELSKEFEERLYGIAWDYVDAMYNALDNFEEYGMNNDELYEVSKLIHETFADGLIYATNKYEEES